MVITRRSALALCTAFCCLCIGTARLDAFQLLATPGFDQTVQYILDLVNAESGAMRSLPSGDTTWTYSMAFAAPCALDLTEERQTARPNAATAGDSIVPVREMTHYVIPAADVEFGRFSTHHVLERDGTMKVTIFTTRASIRRWSGGSSTMPFEAQAVFDASISFGKPNVDNFDIPLRFENALQHLGCLCRAATRPDTDPCASR
jgi:hypothetical protein